MAVELVPLRLMPSLVSFAKSAAKITPFRFIKDPDRRVCFGTAATAFGEFDGDGVPDSLVGGPDDGFAQVVLMYLRGVSRVKDADMGWRNCARRVDAAR